MTDILDPGEAAAAVQMERRRVALEVEKLESELADARSRKTRWRRLVAAATPILSMVAPVVAIFTLATSIGSTNRAARQATFEAQLGTVSNAKAPLTQRRTALRALGGFWKDSDKRTRLRQELLDVFAIEPSRDFRRRVMQELLAGADLDSLLAGVAELNRDARAELADHLDNSVGARPRLAVSENMALEDLPDSTVRELVQRINASGEALASILGQRTEWHRANLRSTLFHVPVFEPPTGDSTRPQLHLLDVPTVFPAGRSFIDSDLSAIGLPLMHVRGLRLHNTRADSAWLLAASLDDVVLSGTSTLRTPIIRDALWTQLGKDNAAETHTMERVEPVRIDTSRTPSSA